MNEQDETVWLLRSIDQQLGVLLALAIRDRSAPETRAAKRSLDGLLDAAGMTQGQIAALTNKSQQAVSQTLATERRTGSRVRKTASKRAKEES